MIIEEASLFKGIASHILDEIAAVAVEEVAPKGTVFFNRGDVAEYLYILESGQVDIVFEGDRVVSFPVKKAGHLFGWSALIEPNTYKAKAVASEESKVIKIDAERLMSIFKHHPAEAFQIMRRLAGVIALTLIRVYEAEAGFPMDKAQTAGTSY